MAGLCIGSQLMNGRPAAPGSLTRASELAGHHPGRAGEHVPDFPVINKAQILDSERSAEASNPINILSKA
jgi:hypothetical protein